jgi:hypothetical protein
MERHFYEICLLCSSQVRLLRVTEFVGWERQHVCVSAIGHAPFSHLTSLILSQFILSFLSLRICRYFQVTSYI